MAEVLKREYDLLVLKTQMRLDREGAGVACALEGRAEGGFETVAEWRCAADELHLPQTLEPSWSRGRVDAFQLPGYLVEQTREAADATADPGTPLWLHFAHPAGYLPLIPWERILAGEIARPILRLPEFLAHPGPSPSGELAVALCATAPVAKTAFPVGDSLERLALAIRRAQPERTVVHVFTDAEYYGDAKARFAAEDRVRVHDPSAAEELSLPATKAGTRGRSGPITNPWLRWMRYELGEEPVDFVHFLCHGFMNRSRAAIAVAQSPTVNFDRRSARFVGAAQLEGFAARLGAWGAGFSSPADNYSEMGLRRVADELARARPGPVIFHELAADSEAEQLERAYQMLFGGGAAEISPAIAVSCHPSFAAGRPEGEAPAPARSSHPERAWKAAGSRYLDKVEMKVAMLQTKAQSRSGSKSAEMREKTAHDMSETLRKLREILDRDDTAGGGGS